MREKKKKYNNNRGSDLAKNLHKTRSYKKTETMYTLRPVSDKSKKKNDKGGKCKPTVNASLFYQENASRCHLGKKKKKRTTTKTTLTTTHIHVHALTAMKEEIEKQTKRKQQHKTKKKAGCVHLTLTPLHVTLRDKQHHHGWRRHHPIFLPRHQVHR